MSSSTSTPPNKFIVSNHANDGYDDIDDEVDDFNDILLLLLLLYIFIKYYINIIYMFICDVLFGFNNG